MDSEAGNIPSKSISVQGFRLSSEGDACHSLQGMVTLEV
jgi:hypothetical protein